MLGKGRCVTISVEMCHYKLCLDWFTEEGSY